MDVDSFLPFVHVEVNHPLSLNQEKLLNIKKEIKDHLLLSRRDPAKERARSNLLPIPQTKSSENFHPSPCQFEPIVISVQSCGPGGFSLEQD
jgi:hypothetical protein